MKLSARNQLAGRVTAVKKGATTTIVKVEIASPGQMTASITNEAVEALGVREGDAVVVVVKSSDVMIGKE